VKTIAKELIRFTREYSHLGFLTSMSLLLVALVSFNFYFDFEDSIIDSYTGSWLKGLWMFLYEGIPYLITVGLLAIFGLKKDWIRKPGFWIHFILGFGILALDRSWFIWNLLKDLWEPVEAFYLYKIISSAKSLISAVLPLLLIYLVLEPKGQREFYGLSFRGFKAKPYFGILGVALIFIFIGGFFGDLQEYYPRYLKSGGAAFAQSLNIPEWRTVALYEFFYGLDFISTELKSRILDLGNAQVPGALRCLPHGCELLCAPLWKASHRSNLVHFWWIHLGNYRLVPPQCLGRGHHPCWRSLGHGNYRLPA
jgi:hypothetical protein